MHSTPTGNYLLDLLPEEDRGRLLKRTERITLHLHDRVCEPGEPIRTANFPLTSVFSSIIPFQDGSVVEAATIGNEGMIGFDLLASRTASVYRVIGQVEGESLQLSAEDFRELLSQSDPLRVLLEKYTMTLIQVSGQSAACNLRHDVQQRMCRWLLMLHDRVGRDEFYLTQEFFGQMLGVRRQSISDSAGQLQHDKLISYSRGNLQILDRAGIERLSCECYRTQAERYHAVMDWNA
jgi:CRP-like cAMP-binding protein